MGQSLNAWCDDDIAAASHQEEKLKMELPAISPQEEFVSSTIAAQGDGDVIDISRLFEEYDTAIKDYADLLRLRDLIQSSGSMNRTIALEATAIYPDFDKHFKVNSFTAEDTGVGMEMALENINAGLAALVGAALVAIGVVIWKIIKIWTGRGKPKDGKNGKVSDGIEGIPSSTEARHENEGNAAKLEDIENIAERTIEELVDLLHEAGVVISNVSITRIQDMDDVFSMFLKARASYNNLSALVPTSPIAASVKVADPFHGQLVKVYKESLTAAETALTKLVEAEVDVDDLIKKDGLFSRSDDKRSSDISTHAGDMKKRFSEARANIVIGGKSIKEVVSELKATSKKLVTDYTDAAAKVTELSVLLHEFYGHRIKAQLLVVNALSANNDQVIDILEGCDKIHNSLMVKAKNANLTPQTSGVIIEYTKVIKGAIDALKDGGDLAQEVRNAWISKTPPLTEAMLGFIQYIMSNEAVQQNDELKAEISKLKHRLEEAHRRIKAAGH